MRLVYHENDGLLRVVSLGFQGQRLLVNRFSFLNDADTFLPLWLSKESANEAESTSPKGEAR
jgi:hypothetical protein